MNKKIEELKSMIGKQYLYNGNEIQILTYQLDGEDVTIITNQPQEKWVTVKVFDLKIKLLEFKTVDLPAVNESKNDQLSVTSNTLISLRDTLLSNIEKVKEDPAFIPQAKNISYNVQTIINLAKIELEIKKTV